MIILKLDFEKAFDTVDHDLIYNMQKHLGFPDRWIGWVRQIMETATSAVLLNGTPGKFFQCKRGVRQGDPMAPYLFNIAMDFLPRWISSLSSARFLEPPFPGCRTCLTYADDTLFLLLPTVQQLERLKLILHIFARLSSLTVSLSKSELLITNCGYELVQQMAAIIECKAASFPIKYLGLPLKDKSLVRSDYRFLIEKIKQIKK